MAIAAVDADDRVNQLVLLTERLTDLIAKEALAFENRRPHEAARYVEETAKLANVYRHESMRVRANVALIEAARPELRQRLKRATEAFDAVLARQATERLPVSRTYMPTLFVNIVGRKAA